ncbi:hypothetical protein K523DRAFT_353604 [Schizophyllum commune Tattone D]|nr:hypothetical protein K523DRAFT_353604 [Schizophyllum commune Tattone D]
MVNYFLSASQKYLCSSELTVDGQAYQTIPSQLQIPPHLANPNAMDSFTTFEFLDDTMPVFNELMPTFDSRTTHPMFGDVPTTYTPSSTSSPDAKAMDDVVHIVVNNDHPCGYGGGYCVIA